MDKPSQATQSPVVKPVPNTDSVAQSSVKTRFGTLAIALPFLVVVVLGLIGYVVWTNTPRPASTQPIATKPISIGVAFADVQGRWQVERTEMIKVAEQLGATVTWTTADQDANLLNRQALNLIAQGVNVLIVVAQDADTATPIIDAAHQAGIKVIAYDRLIKNADLDYYLSFDNEKVGEYQAQAILDTVAKGNFVYIGGSPTDNNAVLFRNGSFKVLQPKIDSGAVKMKLDVMITKWDTKLAYQTVKDYLDKGGKVDAVVVANDGLAGGVIQALQEHGLAGKVAVSGQDAELGACRNIVQGTQTFTVYKPLKQLADDATHLAVDLAQGKAVKTTTVVNNGQVDVPTDLIGTIVVNKSNMMDTIIKDGFYTYKDVYGAN